MSLLCSLNLLGCRKTDGVKLKVAERGKIHKAPNYLFYIYKNEKKVGKPTIEQQKKCTDSSKEHRIFKHLT